MNMEDRFFVTVHEAHDAKFQLENLMGTSDLYNLAQVIG